MSKLNFMATASRTLSLALIITAAASCRPAQYLFSRKPLVDADMTLAEALQGTKAPEAVVDSMAMVWVRYLGFDGKPHQGQMVVNRDLRQDVKDFFAEARREHFPVNSAIPIVQYGWNDDSSMRANNTSSFNYRLVARTNRLSNHSLGRAMDINPYTNPAVHPEGYSEPANARHDTASPGALYQSHPLVKLMEGKGWIWGGCDEWFAVKHYRDYQHFQKLKNSRF